MSKKFIKIAPLCSFITLKNWLTVGTLLIIVIITPLEYLGVKHDRRIERTLQYVERYGEGLYASSAILLDEAIDNQYIQLQEILGDPKLTAVELEKKYSAFILKLFDDTSLRTAITHILRFHGELVQCVINNICDKELAQDFFLNSTGDLLRTYYPYICDKRSKWNDPTAYLAIEQFYLEQPETDICTVNI